MPSEQDSKVIRNVILIAVALIAWISFIAFISVRRYRPHFDIINDAKDRNAEAEKMANP